MYSGVCRAEGYIVALESINGMITKGLTYELIYEIDNDDSICYEFIGDDGMYTQLTEKYFYKIK